MTILRKIANELSKLDVKLEPWAKETECKLFMAFRHLTPLPVEVNALILRQWEPRVCQMIKDMDKESYMDFTKFMGFPFYTNGTECRKVYDFRDKEY